MDKLNDNLSEIMGALLGDGCLSTYWSNSEKTQRYEIAFTGHIGDYKYYESKIQPVFKQELGVSGRLFKRGNSTRYHVRSRKTFEFFKKLGVPVGLKKNSKMEIPKDIAKNSRLTRSFIRGLWATDGSIYRRYSKNYGNQKRVYNYVNLQLKMKAPELIKQVDEFLRKDGFKTNAVTQVYGASVLRITDQKSVKKFAEKIGFGNQRYEQRFKNLSTEPKASDS
ncbi:hypothetical protein H0N95_02515 [Candidatus Micrarchaeota archaeon]|nr:hypothetical protein [Candidatus Micrarchaeota archaeon]